MSHVKFYFAWQASMHRATSHITVNSIPSFVKLIAEHTPTCSLGFIVCGRYFKKKMLFYKFLCNLAFYAKQNTSPAIL
jgi:hypothetical protein